jgi:hypothetical protein
MRRPRPLSGDLYVESDKSSLLLTGLAIETTDETRLEVIGDEVVTTGFGIQSISAIKARDISERAAYHGTKSFESVESVSVRLYPLEAGPYLETTLTEYITDREDYAIFDSWNNQFWLPKRERSDHSVVNFHSFDGSSVKKVNVETFAEERPNRYVPLVKITHRW